jgi:hypothetical protein
VVGAVNTVKQLTMLLGKMNQDQSKQKNNDNFQRDNLVEVKGEISID